MKTHKKMRVKIETYRKWDIYFDTDEEGFYSHSDHYDLEGKKRSYAAVKKFIDDYIKENAVFKPVMVQRLPNGWNGNDGLTIKLIGVRKDKAFMYENSKGEKKQMSSWDEEKFFVINPDNDVHFQKIIELETEKARISKEIKETEAKVIKQGITQLKIDYLEEHGIA
jgi:hypothetical protein